jgi:hypothetical protein
MKRSTLIRTAIIAVLCASIGAAAGITSGSAARHKSRSAASSAQGRWPAPPPGAHGPAVHEEEVVLNHARTAFITATEDNGTVESVSGDQLTVKEAFGNVTYKTVTLTIPSGAKVYRNGSSAQLSDLKRGDHVHVSQSSDGTFVLAGDRAHGPGPGGPGNHHGRGFGPGGPPPGPPPGGPPPGMPNG